MKRKLIGVMGPGDGANKKEIKRAFALGAEIAKKGWVLLSGGRNVGVMEAANQGAHSEGGLTVGILPDGDSRRVSEAVDIAIFTDMGNARNNINVLSSDVVVACGMGAGTLSEIALAIKGKKPVVLLGDERQCETLFTIIGQSPLHVAKNVDEAIQYIEKLLFKPKKKQPEFIKK
ncbi:TIGR00725 family protein [Magnetococcales bacterium HHB-1]